MTSGRVWGAEPSVQAPGCPGRGGHTSPQVCSKDPGLHLPSRPSQQRGGGGGVSPNRDLLPACCTSAPTCLPESLVPGGLVGICPGGLKCPSPAANQDSHGLPPCLPEGTTCPVHLCSEVCGPDLQELTGHTGAAAVSQERGQGREQQSCRETHQTVCTETQTRTPCTRACKHMYTHVDTHAHTDTVHTETHMHTDTCTHINIIHMRHACACTHMYTHADTVHRHTCTQTHVHTPTQCTCTYTHMCTCPHARRHTCTHTDERECFRRRKNDPRCKLGIKEGVEQERNGKYIHRRKHYCKNSDNDDSQGLKCM